MTQTTTTPVQKETCLSQHHTMAGAKMVDFAGWNMPLQFSKVLEEHHAVRKAVGLFDISHMGLISLDSSTGEIEETQSFLNKLVPQDLSTLYPGKAVYTQFLNESGGIIDDIIIYQWPENTSIPGFSEFLVICNASNTDTDLKWMNQHNTSGVQIELQTDYALLALQGPQSLSVLEDLGVSSEDLPKRFHLAQQTLHATPSPLNIEVMICRTGYTGEDGVELIVPKASAKALWELLIETGKTKDLKPIGLAARDTLRLEAAYPLHGHDISTETTPLEAGLGWSVKLDQASDFIGKTALQKQKDQGLKQKFYCFELAKRTIARQHDTILKDGQVIGIITSGSISPTLGKPVAMGYIKSNSDTSSPPYQPGDKIQIQVRGNAVDATIVPRPFYKK